jgi:hypothetical protein
MRSSIGIRLCAGHAALALACLLGGCSDDPRPSSPGVGGTGGMGGGGLVGGAGGGGGGTGAIDGGGAGADGSSDGPVTGDGGTPPVLAPPPLTGLAVINDNYTAMASSLSVLGAAGGVTHADCLDSATGGGGTGSSALSSDVTLPSQPQRGGDIVVIDRGHTALTFVDPATCAVDRQISVAGGFPRANPHDVVIISDTKAYVTRYEKNLVATTPAATGDDVLIIDPRDGSALGRIDLASYAAQVSGSGATVQARPDRAVIAAGKVVVTLNNQDANFAVFGEGRLVVIDPATDAVLEALPLTGLTDCEALAVVPGSPTVLVTCGGAYTDADPASRSSISAGRARRSFAPSRGRRSAARSTSSGSWGRSRGARRAPS